MSSIVIQIEPSSRPEDGDEGKRGKTVFIELFQWRDGEAVNEAHVLPEVMAVWEPMGALTEGMEFFDVEEERA